MSRGRKLGCFRSMILACTLMAAPPPSGEIVYKASMGYLKDGMQHIRQKDVRLALELWIGELMKEKRIETSIVYYDDAAESIEKFRRFGHDMLMVNAYFYLRDEALIDPVAYPSFWVIQHGLQPYEQAVVMVRRDAAIGSVADLKGKRVSMREDNYMGRLFLDREMLQALHRSQSEVIGEIEATENHSRALLQTYFGKSDACVVPRYVVDVVTEMNPAVSQELVPLAESPRIFIPYIGVFHRRTSDTMITAYTDFVRELSATEKGRNILSLFKMQGMYEVSTESIEPMRQYYREYQVLRKRYGVPETISRSAP